ncbi:MAG TPA: type II toxin-antitoxin system HicA family toxin [Gemmataceae bacterium]|jgi:predicted RNA binding protein YcfA (HicA-like mRNA interferase family)|nr:type II toxin-antitoxin system HicA family toxin [Gemmataceae bacterium]
MKPVSGKQMCKALERQGWVRTRTRGSHRRYEKPGQQPITVPVHGNKMLKPRTQRSIMKAAGLTEDDL